MSLGCLVAFKSEIFEKTNILLRGFILSCAVLTRSRRSVADHHLWRCDLQERAVAQGVLHVHQLQHLPGGPALHLPRREAVLR